MTREERTKLIKHLKYNRSIGADYLITDKDADEIIKALEQEPCEDAISRQIISDYVESHIQEINTGYGDLNKHTNRILRMIMEYIDKLPPVTPQTKWTPVSEGLPESFRFVNCTCHSLIDDREDWVVETCYLPQPKNSPYSDWGNIPMLNAGDCEVVAWMYRDIPEPYKAESEDKK